MGNCFLYKRGFGGASGGGSTPEVEKTASGKVISILDSMEKPLKGLRLFGKTTQSGTPSPTAPVPLVSAGDGGSIIVTIGTSESDANPQTLTVSTPNGLPGIHVSEGGNYTDENGWQWICDEVDFARGVYVQRVETVAFDGSEAWEDDRQNGRWYLDVPNIRRVEVLCSHFAYRDVLSGWYGHDGVISGFTSAGHRIFAKDVSPSLPEFLQSESRNSSPVTVLYAIDDKETALSAEQLADYAALRTYSPSTTIFNDADSYMEVKYMAKGG